MRKHLFVLLLLISLAACTSLIPATDLPSTPAETGGAIEETATETLTPAPQPTATGTGIPLTPTSNIIPTLTFDKSREKILEIVEANGDCELPCFLGVQPGISTREEVEQFLQYLHLRYSVDQKEDGTYLSSGFFTRQLNIPVTFEFVENKGIIENIGVGIAFEENLNLEPYELTNVVNNYGMPSRVLLDVVLPHEPPMETGSYNLFLIYDDLDIFISYEGGTIPLTTVLNICPNSKSSDGIQALHLNLGNLNTTYSNRTINNLITLESKDIGEATNVSVEMFYEMFKTESSTSCIKSEGSLWLD